MSLAKLCVNIDAEDIKQTQFIRTFGFSGIDALHITMAEKAKVDYYITCDDNMVKIYRKHQKVFRIPIISIMDFISLEVK